MLRIDRHRLGPRVYVLGARVHEWHLGAAVLLALAGALAFDRIEQRVTALAIASAGLWLVAKDWQDLFPPAATPLHGASACTPVRRRWPAWSASRRCRGSLRSWPCSRDW